MNGSNSGKQSILNLPLAPSLPEFLNPDPAVPTVDSLFSLSSYSSEQATPENSDPSKPDAYKPRPSVLRRSRQVKAHFSYTTPLPLSFPYAVDPTKIKPRKVTGEAVGDGTAVREGAPQEAKAEASKSTPGPSNSKTRLDIEEFLASMEPDWQEPVLAAGTEAKTAYTSETRRAVVGEPQLAGASQTFLSQILPNLDVGDAVEYLQTGKEGSEGEVEKRKELASFLAGHIVRAEKPSSEKQKGFAPWSLCYGGHQFGSWASQLGDGRAVSILTTPAKWPAYHEGTYYPPIAELQLKGAGRTPYSRFADGLAVLRSSVREYLGSEAMAALGVPTSRALSLIHLPDVHVQRERMETGAIVCRVAPSWLRIGSFELPWSRDDWEGLRKLVAYAGKEVFAFGKDDVQKGDEPQDKSLAAKVLRETSRRNARTFAAWQSVGFMHGVLNTDNINISGLTIDYGPYAWMDVYSANHICNHSDGEGRYSYRNQPPIGAEAIQRMGAALGELIGCELEMAEKAGDGKVAMAQEGWASDVSKHTGWTEKAAAVVEDISSEFMGVFIAEYRRLMGKRLGISDPQQADFSNIVNPLLDLMSQHHLDFSRTFRLLTQFTSVDSPHIDRFLDMICPQSSVPEYLRPSSHKDWKEWLQKYQARVEESEKTAGLDSRTRRKRMQAANPRFILRQWILEEAIARLEKDNDAIFLQRVLDMATNPYEEYGEDLVDPAACARPTPEVEEQRRLCGVGDDSMLGFQCSCSS